MSHASAPAASATRPPIRICQFCGNEYPGVRPGSYCGDTCRQRAHRARHRQPVLTSAPPRSRHLDVLYECGACGERLLNERRCQTCNRFARRLGLAVTCTSCDGPLLLAELLEQLGLEVDGPR